ADTPPRKRLLLTTPRPSCEVGESSATVVARQPGPTWPFENCKKVDHMTQDYECGSLRHFKSECPIVKFQKRVDKKISTPAERQTENKRKFENTSRNSQCWELYIPV
ncbi:hypothetical protein Tco_0757594, partial [Tanacetum coccineum]